MTLNENQNAASVHISLRDRWRHFPRKNHCTIGNVLFLLLVPLCLGLCFGMTVLSMMITFGFMGDESHIARFGLDTERFILHLALSIFLALGALRLYWVLLGYLAKRFFKRTSRHDLTLCLIQDAANREIYKSSYEKHVGHEATIKATYATRIDELYSNNASEETISAVRDELRSALEERDTQLEKIRLEILENEGRLGYLEFTTPKLSELWICLPLALLSLCVFAFVSIIHFILL